jgi:protein-tyrosine phosphatase
LWIGHASDCRDFRGIFDTGIEAVVQLAADEPAVAMPREMISCRFPLVDAAGNRRELLEMAITTVAELIRMRIPTLVCCGAGMSRSPSVAAAALSLITGDPPHECLKLVSDGKPSDVTSGLWKEILDVANALRIKKAF